MKHWIKCPLVGIFSPWMWGCFWFLAMAFNLRFTKFSSIWASKMVLGANIYSKKLRIDIKFVKIIYGPSHERAPSWNCLMPKSFMKEGNLIVRVDMNFSFGASKFSSHQALWDPLVEFFVKKLVGSHLIHVNLIKIKPSWRKWEQNMWWSWRV